MKRILATLSTLVVLTAAGAAFADPPMGQFSMDARRFQRDAAVVAQSAHNLAQLVRGPMGRGFRTLQLTGETRAVRQLDEAAARLASEPRPTSQRRLRAEVARVNEAFQVARRFLAWRATRSPVVQADLNEIAEHLANLNAAFVPVAAYTPPAQATVTYLPQAQPTATYAPQPTVTYRPYPQPTGVYAPAAQPTSVYTSGASVSWYQAR